MPWKNQSSICSVLLLQYFIKSNTWVIASYTIVEYTTTEEKKEKQLCQLNSTTMM